MNRVRIYAGVGEHGDGSPIGSHERESVLASIRDYASRTFGGVTIYSHEGSWETNGRIVIEPGITVEVLFESGEGLAKPAALKFARFIQVALGQNTVVVTYEEVNASFVH